MWIAVLAVVGCAPCHQSIVDSFARTGMGRSITRPIAEASPAAKGPGWEVRWRGGALLHRAAGEERRMEWAVGSGNEGKSYLYSVGDALFQSPLAWYRRRAAWDLSPGYQHGQLDFTRPITADCLFCHAGQSTPIAGSVNRYAPLSSPAITCERCHGDSAAHIRQPSRGNIVNPARLDPVRRDSVCEQCHLSGAARVPVPGKQFTDFKPGMALEEVFSVYVGGAAKGLKVVSHVEQLALSRCAQASDGRLWCASCHDPHGQDRTRETCQGCHEKTREHGGPDCAGCHMPRTNAYDGGHTAFTDHRIRRPGQILPGGNPELRAWREPAPQRRARGLGLAYAGVGEMEKAFALLRGMGDGDGEVQTALGLMLSRAGRHELAAVLLRRARDAEPANATRRLNLAAALAAAGRRNEARLEALQAVELEPLLQDAYALLAELEPARAAHWRRAFQKRMALPAR
jgi:hypothetical protein